jgi:methionine synthase I (cobalamin-dependent)
MRLSPFMERVQRGRVIADGAWGSMLLDRGLPAGAPPESWTLHRPEEIAALAREYVDAGAEIITTNTFGGSPARLRQHGLENRCDEINRRGVELAAAAAGGRAYVSASVGPSGVMLRPLGDADPADVEDGFRRQVRALASAGADVICIETMTDLVEATLAVRAARAVAPHLPVIATMTFDITRRGPFTMMGVSVEQAVAGLTAEGASIVGANCGNGVEEMREVASAFFSRRTVPIALRPNAGLPEQTEGRLVYRETPDRFAEAAAALFAGAAIVGGCCGTSPRHIQALARLLRRG